MAKLRIFIRVPDSVQTGPDTFCDTSRITSFDIEIENDSLLNILTKESWNGIIIGGEIINEYHE